MKSLINKHQHRQSRNQSYIIYIYIYFSGMEILKVQQPLRSLFPDINFAWEVLEYQIAIQKADKANAQQIAKLLSLYMYGVERTNSILDPRQHYFMNKVVHLMNKTNVIRGLSSVFKANKKIQIEKDSTPQTPIKHLNNMGLIEKKKEIEARIIYGAEEHSPQRLRRILTEQTNKQIAITQKISAIINDHQQALNQRINKRWKNKIEKPNIFDENHINVLNSYQSVKQIQNTNKNCCKLLSDVKNLNFQSRTHKKL